MDEPTRQLLSSVRCPKCPTVFAVQGSIALCPSCGFQGRVAAASAPAPAATAGAGTGLPAWVPIAVFAVVLMLVVGLIAYRMQGNEPAEVNLGQAAADRDANPDAFTPEQDPAQVGGLQNETGATPNDRTLRFVGIGEQETEPFSVTGGVLRMDARFDGRDGLFSIKVFHVDHAGADQPNESVLAPEFGRFEGAHHIVLPAGSYFLDIGTTGDDASWSIELTYPSAEGADEARITGNGFAARVVQLGEGEHTLHFQAESSGASFAVEIFDWRGQRLPETACGASAYGAYDKQKSCFVPATGPYFVNVQATAGWSITF